MYRKFFKRFIDLILSIIGFILLIPIFAVVTVSLFFANGGKPFFFQRRPGLHERLFRIIKFKTMNDRKDEEGNLLPDAQRLTLIGKFVRKTSLDEVPQLLNVIWGDMSLVGPRPLLVEYLPLYNDIQKKRHNVRPGITGWAQVNGRNTISWDDKFEYDVWYVNHLRFWLDIKIIGMTIVKVFRSEGISNKGHVTIEKFNGNKL